MKIIFLKNLLKGVWFSLPLLLLAVNAHGQYGMLKDGILTAQYDGNGNNEAIPRMVDHRSGTKYLTFTQSNGVGQGPPLYLQWQCFTPTVVDHYYLTAANDAQGRDPKTWQLLGSADGINWTTLDTRTNELFTERFQTRSYGFANSTAYTYYRLNITAIGSGTLFQLAEWMLFEPGEVVSGTGFLDIMRSAGTVTAQYDGNGANEAIGKLVDNDLGSKYLTFNVPPLWLQWEAETAKVANRYFIISANDDDTRDPKTWTLEGSDDAAAWTVLDTRTDEIFTSRRQLKLFSFTNSTAYKFYRLNVSANNGSTSIFQLGEWGLYGDATTVAGSPSALAATTISNTQVRLTWTDIASNESAFEVERSEDGLNFTLAASLVANSTSYIDDGLLPATTYIYRVRAVTPTSSSDYTNIVDAKTAEASGAYFDITDDGGSLSVSKDNTNANESSPKMVDNDTGTKFLIPGPLELPYTFIYQAAGSYVVNEYSITSANDGQSRDFRNWTFEGSNDGTTWSILDTRTNATFQTRFLTKTFSFSNTTSYSRYRIILTGNNGDGNLVQVGEWKIWGRYPDAPAVPTNLAATPVSPFLVQLSWKDNSADETGFEIERSTDGENFSYVATAEPNSTNYTGYDDDELTPSTTYHYRVRAVKSSSKSVYTNIAQATTKVSTITGPADLNAEALSHTEIQLAWTDNSDNETGFEVQRSINGTDFTMLITLDPDATGYTDVGLAHSTQYHYRVRALGTPVNSTYSNIAVATTLLDPNLPVAPANLASGAVSHVQIELTWEDAGNNEDGFEIERSSDGTSFTLITTVNQDVTSYIDEGLTHSTKYYYRARAVNSYGHSPSYTAIVEVTTLVDPNLPAAPSIVAATATSHSMITLTWEDPSTDETGFQIERSPDGTTFTLLATTGANATSHQDPDLSHSTTYYYRIRTINSFGPSVAYSSTVEATTLAHPGLPPAPSQLTLTALSDSEIKIEWKDNSIDAGSFELERSLDGAAFSPVATVPWDKISYVDYNLSKKTEYHYRVRAKNEIGYSGWSDVKKVTTTDLLVVLYDITNDGGILTALYQSTNSADGVYSPASEDYTKLTDNNNGSKYLIFGNPANYWFQYEGTKQYVVNKYTIVTANDAQSRDAKDWTFQGSNDGVSWSVLDTRTNQFTDVNTPRSTPFSFGFTNTTAYKYYRLHVTANNGATNIMGQIAEWQIWESNPSIPVSSASIKATAVSGEAIRIEWKDEDTSETGFEIERSSDGQTFTQIHVAAADIISYTDTALNPLTTYYYRVRVVGQAGFSPYTWVASATTLQSADAPMAPAELVATPVSESEIALTWSNQDDNGTAIEIERSPDGNTFTTIATVAADETAYTDTGLLVATRYYYRIRSKNDTAPSAYSQTVRTITTGNNLPPALDLIPDQSTCSETPQTIELTGINGPESWQQITLSVGSTSPNLFDELSISAVSGGKAMITYKIKAGLTGATTVTVTATDNGGTFNEGSDSFSRSFILTIFELPVSISADVDGLVPRGATVNLTASGGEQYEWTDGPGILGGENSGVLTVKPIQNFVYEVTATTSTGCTNTATITLKMEGNSLIEVVNILTPNNDGKNDQWVIWNINTFPGNEVKVLDKAGRVVYSRKDYANDWDGTFQGSRLTEGVYFYVINLGSGIAPEKGTITILQDR